MDISRPCKPEKLIPLLPWPGFDHSSSDRSAIGAGELPIGIFTYYIVLSNVGISLLFDNFIKNGRIYFYLFVYSFLLMILIIYQMDLF